MSRARAAWGLVCMLAALVLLGAACEKVKPSKPFEATVTHIATVAPPNADLAGAVRDQDGEPIGNASVSLVGAGDARTTVTNAGGSYRIRSLAAGAYEVTASKEGYAPARQRVVLAGKAVAGVTMVLEAYEAAPGHQAESVEVSEAGEVVHATTLRSEPSPGIPAAELEMEEGTVLRESTGQVASRSVTVRVTPIPRDRLGPPSLGTFGVGEEDLGRQPGRYTATKVDQADLGEARVAEDVTISEPNPLLREGAQTRVVTPVAAFVLEPGGLTFEDQDGSPRGQALVLRDLPFVGLLPEGSTLALVDRNGNTVAATVLSDGSSVEAQITRLTRYDLLLRLTVDVLERSVLSAGVPVPLSRPAQGGLYQHEDGTTILFPELDWDQDMIDTLGDLVREALAAYSVPPGEIGEALYVLSEGRLRLVGLSVGEQQIVGETEATLDNQSRIGFMYHSQGQLE